MINVEHQNNHSYQSYGEHYLEVELHACEIALAFGFELSRPCWRNAQTSEGNNFIMFSYKEHKLKTPFDEKELALHGILAGILFTIGAIRKTLVKKPGISSDQRAELLMHAQSLEDDGVKLADSVQACVLFKSALNYVNPLNIAILVTYEKYLKDYSKIPCNQSAIDGHIMFVPMELEVTLKIDHEEVTVSNDIAAQFLNALGTNLFLSLIRSTTPPALFFLARNVSRVYVDAAEIDLLSKEMSREIG